MKEWLQAPSYPTLPSHSTHSVPHSRACSHDLVGVAPSAVAWLAGVQEPKPAEGCGLSKSSPQALHSPWGEASRQRWSLRGPRVHRHRSGFEILGSFAIAQTGCLSQSPA